MKTMRALRDDPGLSGAWAKLTQARIFDLEARMRWLERSTGGRYY